MLGEQPFSNKGTCGALVGGMLAIGSVVGRTYQDFSEGKCKRRVFQYGKKLFDRFEEVYPGPLCKDVQQHLFGRSYNLCDQKEYDMFEKAGVHINKCPSVAGNVAKWTVEILTPLIKKQSSTRRVTDRE